MNLKSVVHDRFAVAVLLLGVICAACASGSSGFTKSSTTPPSPDPRIGLRAGKVDAAAAAWNLRLLSNTPAAEPFAAATNSDLAFSGKYAIQGNYNGYQVWDISDPRRPRLATSYVCPASQSDVSVYGNLLFVSGEGLGGRLDCGMQGVPDTVSQERLRGIRIFDISDITKPRYVANVQTCRGSHTHTVVHDPKDAANVYIYVSGSAPVRSPSELPGCSGLAPDQDPNSALFRIEVIRVPTGAPQQAAVVSSPRIFSDLAAPPRHGELPADTVGRSRRRTGGAAARMRSGPTQCHDITVYPEVGLAAGACGGYGLLLDISDVAHPTRLNAVSDSNFSFWHSATFSNDGSKILFSDEWGGGSQPRCRVTDKPEWGADAIFTRSGKDLTFRSYYKLPAAQTPLENCVAHNGSLIPVPGRDIMVQGWYQGGISVFDWTDPEQPKEIAFFDRGPVDSTRLVSGGSWSAYWYNGHIYSSEIARGLDVYELLPSGLLSQDEIAAARLVQFGFLNVQDQPKFTWPASFVVARAYVDQLERGQGLPSASVAQVRRALARAEKLSGDAREAALTPLLAQLENDARTSTDGARVQALITVLKELAAARS